MSAARSSQETKYHSLANTLIAEIEKGRLSVGGKFPGELELVKKYSVSRFTVRSALRLLEEMGLVLRRRGSGTIVTADRAFQMYKQTARSIADLTQMPEDCERELIESGTVQVGASLAEALGCAAGTEWNLYSMLRRRSSQRTVLCWQDIYVRPSLNPSCTWLLKNHAVGTVKDYQQFNSHSHETHVDVTVGRVPKHMAAPLKVAADSPALVVTRRYVSSDDEPYCIAVLYYPEGRFTYSFRYTR